MFNDKLQSFYFQTLPMKRDNIKGTLQAAISSFQKDLHSETISHIQYLSNLTLQTSQFSTLFLFFVENTKTMWRMVKWVKEKASRFFNNKTSKMVELILILLGQGAQNIYSSYRQKEKDYQIKFKQVEKLLMTERTDIQIFQQQLCFRFSAKQIKQMFQQLGEKLEKEDIQLAIKLYYLYFQIDHSNDSKSLLGESLIKAGETVKGLNYLRQIDYQDYGLQGLMKLAKVYFLLKDFKYSVKTYLQIIKLDNGSQLTTKSHFEIAIIYQNLLFYSQAVKRYQLSLRFNLRRNDEEKELYWKAITKIGCIYAYNQDHYSSVSIFLKMIEMENIPLAYQIEAIQFVGRCLFKMKNFQKSLYYYQKLQHLLQDKQIQPSSNCLEKIIQISIILNDYSMSKQYIQKLLQKEDNKCKAYIYLSYVEFKLGCLNSSKLYLTNAENADKNKTLTSPYYIQIIEGIYGSNDISRGFIQNAKTQSLILAERYEQLASQLRKGLRCDQSLFHLRQSIRYNGQARASVYFQLGFSLTISQRFPEAITYLNQAINLDERHEDALQLLFGIHHDLKRKEEMMECVKKLEKINFQKAKRLMDLVQFQYQQKAAEAQIVDGVNLCLLPSPSKKDAYLDSLHRAVYQFEFGSRIEGYKILTDLFNTSFDETQKLYNCACYLAQRNLLQFASMFCKRYFILQPFKVKNFIKYTKMLSSKGKITKQDHQHLDLFKDYVKLDDEAYYELAKMTYKLKDYAWSVSYMTSAIQLSMKEEYYTFLQRMMGKISLEGEKMLVKMNQIRSDYWKVHERLSKVYRRQRKQDLQVCSLQEAMKHTWNKEKCLMRLCDIFKSSPDRYFTYAKQLAQIQATNDNLLMEVVELYGSRSLFQPQILTYNQVLRLNPSKKGLFQQMQKILARISNSKDVNSSSLFYQRLLDDQNQSNSFILCFLYKHYNKISESFSCFLLGIQEIYSKNKPDYAKRKLGQIRQWFSGHSKESLDNDSRLKKLILDQHLSEVDKEGNTILLRQALFLGAPVATSKLKDCPDNLERFWQGYLSYYSKQHIAYIIGLVLSQLGRKTKSAVEPCKRFISSQHPEVEFEVLFKKMID